MFTMTRLLLKDEVLDAQLLRAIGAALYGGADVGECLGAARRVRGTDLDSWFEDWHATAELVAELAQTFWIRGESATPPELGWRAQSIRSQEMSQPGGPRSVTARSGAWAALRDVFPGDGSTATSSSPI
jgi:hypothetical protein